VGAARQRRATPAKEAIMIDRYGSMGRGIGLRQLMDRMLEDAFVVPREGSTEGWGGPVMDVYEEGDNLVVEAHLPGTKPEDLDLNVEQGVLTISGRTESEQERKERNYLLREKRSGRFTRSLQLPSGYNTENCQANFEQGVLRLTFPKAEEAKRRRIQIGTGGQQAIEGKQPQAADGTRMKPEDRA
jgi:HSP20 family protein